MRQQQRVDYSSLLGVKFNRMKGNFSLSRIGQVSFDSPPAASQLFSDLVDRQPAVMQCELG